MKHAIQLALLFIGCGILGVWISMFILYTSLILPYQFFLRAFYGRSLFHTIRNHLRDPWE